MANDEVEIVVVVKDRASDALQELRKTMVSLAPAALPALAATAPMAAAFASAGVAAAAFGAAAAGQLIALKDVTTAQTKAGAAAKTYGAGSAQAATAQKAYQAALAGLPAATRQAALGFQVLTKDFQSWSNGLAQFTMVPVTRGMAVLGAVLPKLSPLVESTSLQLSRLVTVAGGAVSSPGFDALSKRFSDYTDGVLQRATDQTIHFARVLSEGKASGPISEFMRYAREQGPVVRDTLKNLATAVVHLVEGASQAGPGMLTLVNAMAKLVAAVPASVIANLLGVYTAFRAIRTVSMGFSAGAAAVQLLVGRIVALRAASDMAGGGLRGLGAAFGTLSTAAKTGVVLAGIAALALVLTKLSDAGQRAPANVDKMSGALGRLGRTGAVTGEASRVFGKHLDDLGYAVDRVSGKSGGMDKFNDVMNTIFTLGMGKSNSLKQAQGDIDSLDKGLADLVKGGHADLAAAALKRLQDSYAKGGKDPALLAKQMDDYNSALSDQAFEAKLTADAQGLFGQQALATQQALEAQKASADGLRQSIEALNDVNRAALGGMIGFEQAIDDVAKAAKADAGALRMSHGQLDLNGKKARDAASKLSDLASKTKDATTSALDAGKSWSDVAAIYDRGRSKFMAAAQTMGLTRNEAKKLADQIMKTPDKTAYLKGNIGDLQKKVDAAKAKLKTVPPSKQASIRAEIRDLEAKIAQAKRDLAAMDGRTATTHITTVYDAHYNPATGSVFGTGRAMGGIVGAAGGGPRSNLTLVGEQGPEYVRLPYGSTVIPAGTTRSMLKGEREAAAGARGAFGISHFGQMAGWARNPFEKSLGAGAGVGDLVGTLNQWAATVRKATHGLAETRLLRDLDVAGRALIHNEKAYERVNAALDKAKEKLGSLKDAFGQLRDSVASGIVSFGNITKAAGQAGGGRLTVSGIRDSLHDARDKATSFASALAQLKKKGLSADAIAQIAAAGIEGGGLETAGALLSGSKSDIADLNKLQAQIKKAAAAAGNTTADAMYGAGIKAAEGMVKGLEKQRHHLEAIMESLAKALEKAIKRAIGAKATGGIVGSAAGGGPRSALTWVGEMGPELVSIAPGSMVHTAGDSRRMTTPAGGGGPIVIHLTIGAQQLGEIVLDPLRRTIATRGGNVQAVLGR